MKTYYGYNHANREGQGAWFNTRAAAERFNAACGGDLGEVQTCDEPDPAALMDTPGEPWTRDPVAHTPGPWRVAAHDSLRGVYHIDAGPQGHERTTVAIINAGPASASDARLIAAAPELLGVLRQVVSMYERGYVGGVSEQTGGAFLSGIADARAAIARAEGGAS